ncbi:hypothetical protein GOODEAATRI_017379 [Goodea atripinnis]|uniref:Uncharacterized protein n=1 Tax=Goodea atripinnis TaxID=208336 RepID=A0ABV0PYS5_9TELE
MQVDQTKTLTADDDPNHLLPHQFSTHHQDPPNSEEGFQLFQLRWMNFDPICLQQEGSPVLPLMQAEMKRFIFSPCGWLGSDGITSCSASKQKLESVLEMFVKFTTFKNEIFPLGSDADQKPTSNMVNLGHKIKQKQSSASERI